MDKELIQGSASWLELRKKCVTSTDAAIINGTNTFRGNSPYKLWQKKMGLIDEDPVNKAMLEGTRLEEIARNLFNKDLALENERMQPKVVFHSEYDWIMSSLDGYNEEADHILEITCGVRAYEQAAMYEVPKYYYDQIQHSLFASNKSHCKYMCYRIGKDPIVILVDRDDNHIQMLLEKEKAFYECLQNMTPPSYETVDYIQIENEQLKTLEIQWQELNTQIKEMKEKENKLRKQMYDFGDDGNFIGHRLKFTRILQTKIDYKKAAITSKIDLAPFVQEKIGYYRITSIEKES